MIVLDASCALAWLLQEPAIMQAPEVYAALPEEAVVVPSHWPAEMANGLVANVRAGRLALEDFDRIVKNLAILQVKVDGAPAMEEIEVIARFAMDQGLTVYDGVYVELAAKLEAPLASLDREMRTAAKRLGLTVLPA